MRLEQEGQKKAPEPRPSVPAPSRAPRPQPRQKATPHTDKASDSNVKTSGGGAAARLWSWFDTHDLAFSCAVAGACSAAVALLAYAAQFLLKA